MLVGDFARRIVSYSGDNWECNMTISNLFSAFLPTILSCLLLGSLPVEATHLEQAILATQQEEFTQADLLLSNLPESIIREYGRGIVTIPIDLNQSIQHLDRALVLLENISSQEKDVVRIKLLRLINSGIEPYPSLFSDHTDSRLWHSTDRVAAIYETIFDLIFLQLK